MRSDPVARNQRTGFSSPFAGLVESDGVRNLSREEPVRCFGPIFERGGLA